MTQAKAVLEKFCSQACIGSQLECRKREIIQLHIKQMILTVNQVIYTLDTICELNIMTLAQAVLEIFCSEGYLLHKITKSEKGNTSVHYEKTFTKS